MAALLASQGQPLEIDKLSEIQINRVIHAYKDRRAHFEISDYENPTKRFREPCKTIANPHL